MIAAILCPGPSLAEWSQAEIDADLIIGVNRSVLRFQCHVWAAQDYPLIALLLAESHKHSILPVPGPRRPPHLFTIRASAARSAVREWPGGVTCREDTVDPFCALSCDVLAEGDVLHVTPAQGFTAHAAIAYAAFLGSTRVRMYGMDLDGELDYDGVPGGRLHRDSCQSTERSRSRWEKEAAALTALRRWLGTRGIAVTVMRKCDNSPTMTRRRLA